MSQKLKHLIAVVGMPGSGKGTCTNYLDRFFPVVHFGQMVINEVKNRHLEVNEANEKSVREDLRQQYGPAAIASLAADSINELSDQYEIVVIDGLYSWSEYQLFAEKYGDKLTVIGVFTPRRLRYQRLAERTYRPLTQAEASTRDIAEIENLDKGGPIARADYMLVNTSTPERLQQELTELLDHELGIKLPS